MNTVAERILAAGEAYRLKCSLAAFPDQKAAKTMAKRMIHFQRIARNYRSVAVPTPGQRIGASGRTGANGRPDAFYTDKVAR